MVHANKYYGSGIGLLLLSFSFIVMADDFSGTAWDLDNLQKQRVLYAAKAAVNKARAEAEEARGNFISGTTSLTPNDADSINKSTMSTTPGITPQLVKINGRNAVISMPDGNSTTVSVGQMLPGGHWQVVSISINGVKVRNISTRREEILN